MCLGSITLEPGPGVEPGKGDTSPDTGDMRGGVTPSPSSNTSSLADSGSAMGGWNQGGRAGRGRGDSLLPSPGVTPSWCSGSERLRLAGRGQSCSSPASSSLLLLLALSPPLSPPLSAGPAH